MLGFGWPVLGFGWPVLGFGWPVLGLGWPVLGFERLTFPDWRAHPCRVTLSVSHVLL